MPPEGASTVFVDPVILERRLKTAENAIAHLRQQLPILERDLKEIREGMVKSGQIQDQQLELGGE